MRFSLDVPVEKRSIKAKDAIRLDLEFPPPIEATEAQADWQARSANVLACLKPGRVPGPVKLTLLYEERAGRRDLEHLIRPVVALCVRHALIDSDIAAPCAKCARLGGGARLAGGDRTGTGHDTRYELVHHTMILKALSAPATA